MRRLLLVPFAVLVVLAACGSEEAAPPSAGPGPSGDGAAIYASSCASCHGTDLRGTDRGPSHLSIVYEPGHHGDDSFRAAIRNGAPQHHWDFGPMPPVDGLTVEDEDAVIAYIRTVQAREGFEP